MILFKIRGKYEGQVMRVGEKWVFHVYDDKVTHFFNDKDSALIAARECFKKFNPPRGEPIEEYYTRKVKA